MKIIEFPIQVEEKEYPEETFERLIDRSEEYLEFLRAQAPKKHKSEWCKKIIAVLKFLGDYKLDEDIKKLN